MNTPRMARRRAGIATVCGVALLALLPNAALAARSWRAPVAVSGAEAHAYDESLAVTATHRVVAWSETTATSGHGWIAAVAPDGSLGPATDVGAVAEGPWVAEAAPGEVLAAWMPADRTSGAIGPVKVAPVSPAGGVGTPVDVVSHVHGSVQFRTAASGHAAVLYTRYVYVAERDERHVLLARRRSPAGVWSPAEVIDVGEPDDWIRLYDAALAADGALVATWIRLSYDGPDQPSRAAMIPAGGGPARPLRRADDGDGFVSGFAVAADDVGRLVAAWPEPIPGVAEHPLRYAVRQPGADDFDAPRPMQGRDAVPRLDGAGDGRFVAYWSQRGVNGNPNHYGARASFAHFPASGFATPVNPTWGTSPGGALAKIDAAGNAIFLFSHGGTGERRIVRRSAAGIYGRPRNLTCPILQGYTSDAGIDAQGNVLTLNRHGRGSWPKRSLLVDAPSASPAPDPCPRRPPYYVTDPEFVEPGEEVTLDATGAHADEERATRYEWDLDYDGVYERDTGEDGTTEHTFDQAGVVPVRVRLTFPADPPGYPNGHVMNGGFDVEVGTGKPTRVDAPAAEPTPPPTPDEQPWPIADGGPQPPPEPYDEPEPPPPGSEPPPDEGAPAEVELEPVAAGDGVAATEAEARAPAFGPFLAGPQPEPARLWAWVAAGQRGALRRGVPVHLAANASMRAEASLSAGRYTLAPPRGVWLVAGSPRRVVLWLNDRGRRLLRRRGVLRARLRARSDRGPDAVASVVLRR